MSGETAGRPTLCRLTGDPDSFAARHWGSSPLHRPGADPDGFADLFGPDAVDTLLSERGLRTPFLRLAREGRTAGDREFTSGGGVGALIADQVSEDRVLTAYADGSTIVLQALHRTWAPLLTFSQQLAAELAHPVQVNAYITPAQNRGFDDHYDVHDVFVLQIDGEKHWQVRPPVWPDPLRNQPWPEHTDAIRDAVAGDPLLDVVLRPGDCLYLPRGYLHSATARGRSIHLTVGVHVWTRAHLVQALLRQATEQLDGDPQWRRSLPLGVDLAAAAHDLEPVRDALQAALGQVPGDAVAADLLGRARAAQRPEPLGPLAQLAAAEQPAGQRSGRLRLRAHLMAHLDDDGTLVSRAGTLTVAPDEVPAVRQLLDTGDLGRLHPDLTRRLLIGGILHPGSARG